MDSLVAAVAVVVAEPYASSDEVDEQVLPVDVTLFHDALTPTVPPAAADDDDEEDRNDVVQLLVTREKKPLLPPDVDDVDALTTTVCLDLTSTSDPANIDVDDGCFGDNDDVTGW